MDEGRVTGFYHAGISVKNLEESIQFYSEKLDFELLSRQDVDRDYIFDIVAVPGLKQVRIAFLKIPGSNAVVELLEYVGVERFSGSCRPCDYGSGHLCLYVSNLDDMYKKLQKDGVKFKSNAPVSITAGRNEGAKVVYMMDPDGYIVELLQPANV